MLLSFDKYIPLVLPLDEKKGSLRLKGSVVNYTHY